MQTVLFVNERGQVLITCDEPVRVTPRDLLWDAAANRLLLRLPNAADIEIGRGVSPELSPALDAAETALLVEMENGQPIGGLDLRIVKAAG